MTGQRTDAAQGDPMIAAIYARKSTDQNGMANEDKSVTRQIEHARAYAVGKGWAVADEHIYSDDGISGAEFAKRPGCLRLMNALKPRPPFDVLIMSEESRLGREQIETGAQADHHGGRAGVLHPGRAGAHARQPDRQNPAVADRLC